MCCTMSKETKTKNTIDPFNDWSFKFIFGREETKDIMMGFLNVLLNPEEPIKDITYINTESNADDPDGKRCVVDVLCEDLSGDRFLVEMQYARMTNIRNRIIYYTCRLIDEMGRKGNDWNYELQRVYTICLMDFNYADNPVLRNDIMLIDAETGDPFSDRLCITTLQIPCLRAKTPKDCRESYEKLLSLLNILKDDKMTLQEVCAEIAASNASPEAKAIMQRIAERADYASLTPKERAAYDAEQKRLRDNAAALDYAKKEGQEQGFAKGREEGILQVAREMKRIGEPVEKIVLVTGLSEEQIAKL